MHITDQLVQEGHLDPDLWEVFLKERVAFLYGAAHLKQEQLDI